MSTKCMKLADRTVSDTATCPRINCIELHCRYHAIRPGSTAANPITISDSEDDHHKDSGHDHSDCEHSDGDCPTDWDSELEGDFGGTCPVWELGTPERLEGEGEELMERWAEWENKMKEPCCKRKYYKYNPKLGGS
ncbi:hypothetical protein BJ508DRAFT_327603 [Ascobolus immersus RN42]|uniref:Uncharacterized protein n=1 Tax=Ascobolus immersus RN42 TaxID=1160509 RepID=A0A3N4I7M4_ASCIM|nr:hypothetical protein BJ508DRAFT_327603 [Ascobolus immersus RN42]